MIKNTTKQKKKQEKHTKNKKDCPTYIKKQKNNK